MWSSPSRTLGLPWCPWSRSWLRFISRYSGHLFMFDSGRTVDCRVHPSPSHPYSRCLSFCLLVWLPVYLLDCLLECVSAFLSLYPLNSDLHVVLYRRLVKRDRETERQRDWDTFAAVRRMNSVLHVLLTETGKAMQTQLRLLNEWRAFSTRSWVGHRASERSRERKRDRETEWEPESERDWLRVVNVYLLPARCLMSASYYLLSTVCSLLSAVSCRLAVVSSLLLVACCLLSASWC